ncbi:DUF58 domain-containing protein [Haloarchaeobius sp. HME9146]|uniref:DUF58 domain-containing protein n=1 Tax=Haloarchaeobius sp. HME9146 TaxID=2978732 RepID=UPI0021C0587F|nr:DUF58 domain-containing protein [Haloarchaeobius sp. HME9146]MCT9098506.1 DUF58 domain-containing protein [Haloarchaeobius sp. HME9146]
MTGKSGSGSGSGSGAGGSVTRLDRWRGVTAATVAFVAAGVATGRPELLLAGAIPLVFVAYSALSTVTPVGDGLRVERTVEPPAPIPGQRVTVTLTVENTGDRALTDVRLVDGVPEGMTVVEGSPVGAVSLRPGASTDLAYTLVPQRGTHEFDPVAVRARSLSASAVVTEDVPTTGTETVDCRVTVEDMPVQDQTMFFTGPLATDTGGPGVEFHKTRDYRRGDPMNRIDWRRLAKRGELVTIEYQEHRSARVVVVLDSREEARQSAATGFPTGATLSAYAGALALDALADAGHQVGLAAFGIQTPGDGRVPAPAWVGPESGRGFTARAVQVVDAATAADGVGASGPLTGGAGTDGAGGEESTPEESEQAVATDGGSAELDRLLARLPSDAQVLFVTPALDDFPVTVARTLRGYGHRTTVLSPDVTGGRSAGQQVVTMERALRLDEMRTAGAPVVDWAHDTPLPMALAQAIRPWVN